MPREALLQSVISRISAKQTKATLEAAPSSTK